MSNSWKNKRSERRFEDDNLEIYSKIRKPMPPPTKVMKSKRDYRRDNNWKNWEDEKGGT
jgi:hypothetical protein